MSGAGRDYGNEGPLHNIMKNHFFVEAPLDALLYPEPSKQQIFLYTLELPKAKLYISRIFITKHSFISRAFLAKPSFMPGAFLAKESIISKALWQRKALYLELS